MANDTDPDDSGEKLAPSADSLMRTLLASQFADLTRLIALGTMMAESSERMNPASASALRKEVLKLCRARDRLALLQGPAARRPAAGPPPGMTIH